MEVLAMCLLQLFFSLFLKLNKLCPLKITCNFIVLIGENLSLMGSESISLGLTLQFGFEFTDFSLLQLRDEVKALHGKIWVIVPSKRLKSRINCFLSFWLKYLNIFSFCSPMNTNLNCFIFFMFLFLYYFLFAQFRLFDYFSFGLIVLLLFSLFKDKFVGHIFKLVLNLNNEKATLSISASNSCSWFY